MSLISAIIMASGFSRRMGENKLLMKYNNKFLIEYTLDVISKCNFKDKLIVTQYEKRKEIGENLDFKVVKNKYPNRGISESIKLGIKNIDKLDISKREDAFNDKNINLIEDLAYKMGFKHVKRICPKYHDEMIAFTSQLPHALAVALINSDIEGRNTGEFIGDSYRDLTRIANINESLWSQLFLGNKENLLKTIYNFEAELDKIKACLEKDDKEGLQELFIKSSKRREKL